MFRDRDKTIHRQLSITIFAHFAEKCEIYSMKPDEHINYIFDRTSEPDRLEFCPADGTNQPVWRYSNTTGIKPAAQGRENPQACWREWGLN